MESLAGGTIGGREDGAGTITHSHILRTVGNCSIELRETFGTGCAEILSSVMNQIKIMKMERDKIVPMLRLLK